MKGGEGMIALQTNEILATGARRVDLESGRKMGTGRFLLNHSPVSSHVILL